MLRATNGRPPSPFPRITIVDAGPRRLGDRHAGCVGPPVLTLSPTLAGVGALVLWAFLAALTSLAQPLPPLLTAALGLGCGGLLGMGVVAARGRLHALRQPWLVWLHGVAGIGGYHALYFAAFALAPPIEANLLNYLWPLLMVLLAAPLGGLPLGHLTLAGVLLGAAGAVVLLGDGAAFPAAAFAGFACAVGAAVVWALYSVLAARLPRSPTDGVAGFCLVAAALAGAAHLAFEAPVSIAPRQALPLFLLGAGPLGAAFFLWDIGTKRGDPRLLGTLAYGVPVASTLLLVGVGGGDVSWRLAAAAALVAGGGVLAALGNRAEAARRGDPAAPG